MPPLLFLLPVQTKVCWSNKCGGALHVRVGGMCRPNPYYKGNLNPPHPYALVRPRSGKLTQMGP